MKKYILSLLNYFIIFLPIQYSHTKWYKTIYTIYEREREEKNIYINSICFMNL